MARIRPKLISLIVDDVDRSEEVKKAVITSGPSDADFQSYAASRRGGDRDYNLVMTIAQDPATGTLYDLIWTEPGTEVSGVYAPFGNEEPMVGKPHWPFIAEVREPDGDILGAEANSNYKEVAVVEVTWPLNERPVPIES